MLFSWFDVHTLLNNNLLTSYDVYARRKIAHIIPGAHALPAQVINKPIGLNRSVLLSCHVLYGCRRRITIKAERELRGNAFCICYGNIPTCTHTAVPSRSEMLHITVIYSRSRQEVRMVGDGGAWTEVQRPYLNHATFLVFSLCLSFKARD